MRNIPNQLSRIQDKYNITEEHEKPKHGAIISIFCNLFTEWLPLAETSTETACYRTT